MEEEVQPLELSQLFVVSISNAEITRGGDIQDMLCPISIQDGAIDKKWFHIQNRNAQYAISAAVKITGPLNSRIPFWTHLIDH